MGKHTFHPNPKGFPHVLLFYKINKVSLFVFPGYFKYTVKKLLQIFKDKTSGKADKILLSVQLKKQQQAWQPFSLCLFPLKLDLPAAQTGANLPSFHGPNLHSSLSRCRCCGRHPQSRGALPPPSAQRTPSLSLQPVHPLPGHILPALPTCFPSTPSLLPAPTCTPTLSPAPSCPSAASTSGFPSPQVSQWTDFALQGFMGPAAPPCF